MNSSTEVNQIIDKIKSNGERMKEFALQSHDFYREMWSQSISSEHKEHLKNLIELNTELIELIGIENKQLMNRLNQ